MKKKHFAKLSTDSFRRRRHMKTWVLFFGLGTLFLLTIMKTSLISYRKNYTQVKHSEKYVEKPTAKKDWHDYKAMYSDCQRIGIGEQGKGSKLDSKKVNRTLEQKMIQQHGLNALLSDAISVNRSVPDVRDKGCLQKTYLAKLPTISVVIPFYNEYLSTFTRTLHSLVNRTPPELLKEIILVDDFSDPEFFENLSHYTADHFEKVQFVRLPERSGLIRARLAGARKATAEILVILDAHIEVNYNWLPPLIEPIALNNRTVTCPIIDGISPDNLEYYPSGLSRGGFDGFLLYKEIDPYNLVDTTKPFDTPVMMGGLFAISLDYFWELGGYDEDLEIYGGEQFELSFKIWMCGGQLINVPCSRVGHHFRGILDKGLNAKNDHYLMRNYKRVAEVWMDEYKDSMYTHYGNTIFNYIDAGDLTERKALREKLHCKSFNWYVKEIAFDFDRIYPAIELPPYAHGVIQSVAAPNLCVDKLDSNSPGLYPCVNVTNAQYNQKFKLTSNRDIRWHDSYSCLDVPYRSKNAPVILYPCHGKGGPQFWYYDRKTKWVNGMDREFCLEGVLSNFTLRMNICKEDNLNMKWNFGVVNDTALDKFFENMTFL